MTDPTVILSIFDKVLNVIGLISDRKIKRNEKINTSLLLLYTALAETKTYSVSLSEGGIRKANTESNLARLWHEASIPLRDIDPDLAEICFYKGSYWLEPQAWDEVRVQESQIALDNVFEKTRMLLIGG